MFMQRKWLLSVLGLLMIGWLQSRVRRTTKVGCLPPNWEREFSSDYRCRTGCPGTSESRGWHARESGAL